MKLLPRRRERVEDRDLTRDTMPAALFPDGSPNAPGVRSAKQIATVYACLRALGDGVALVPLVFYRKVGQRAVKVEEGANVELLQRPASGVPGPAFVGEMAATLAAHGELFVGKWRGVDHTVNKLGLLPPDRVQIRLESGEPIYTFVHENGVINDNLTRDSVLHVRGALTDETGIRGISPIKVCRDSLSLAQSLTQSAASLWRNSGRPDGLLTIPNGPGADDQAAAVAKKWEERHGGPEQRGKTGVLVGDVKWQSTQLSVADAQWVDTVRMSVAEIARIFRVPAWVIGADTGQTSLTYSNTSEQLSAFARFALAPLCTYIESAISNDEDLCPGDQFARFDLSELTRGDASARAERNSKALDPVTGWLSRDEVREIEGYAPDGEAAAA